MIRQLRNLFTYWCHMCCLRFRRDNLISVHGRGSLSDVYGLLHFSLVPVGFTGQYFCVLQGNGVSCGPAMISYSCWFIQVCVFLTDRNVVLIFVIMLQSKLIIIQYDSMQFYILLHPRHFCSSTTLCSGHICPLRSLLTLALQLNTSFFVFSFFCPLPICFSSNNMPFH